MTQTAHKLTTGQDIRNILGPVDDELINDVMQTGATVGEIAQAYEWLNGDDYMGTELRKPMNDNIRRVYEILQNDRDRISPDER